MDSSRLPGRLLAIDMRSLAACRIALGVALLVDLGIRFWEIPVFLTDNGMFPREFMPSSPLRWSLHAVRGDAAWAGLLFGVHGAAACLLLAGAWTRAATVVCWLMAVSLQVRNPLITNSGDALLRMALFWGMFLPWGRRWGWDARRLGRLNVTGPSWATAGMLLQLCLAYGVTGALKLNEQWLQGEAMSKVVALDFCVRPLGRALADDPHLLRAASLAAPWIELGAPLLLWLPLRTAAVRTLVVLGMIVFHWLVELTLHVGMFGWISQAYWLVFLPPPFWDRLAGASPPQPAPAARPWPAASAFCAAMLLMVTLLCLDGAFPAAQKRPRADVERTPLGDPLGASSRWWTPPWLRAVAEALMMEQHWMMFDRPPVVDRWVVARADLADGRQVDVLRDGAAWDPRGAPLTAARLPSQHWRYYFFRLSWPRFRHLAPRAAEVLLEKWNLRHGPGQQAQRVALIEFRERFGEPGFVAETLAVARAASEGFDLEGALEELDQRLQATD